VTGDGREQKSGEQRPLCNRKWGKVVWQSVPLALVALDARLLPSHFLLASGLSHPLALKAYIYGHLPIASHFTLKMEAAWTYEMLASHHTTVQHHNLE